jgi:hypothetical protein
LVLVIVMVRTVGIASGQVSFAAVLTAFAAARLVGGLSITPGGLGRFDATFAGMLTAFGAKSSQALAVDLIWRLTTYFFPILLGIVTYIIWIRREERSAAHSTDGDSRDRFREDPRASLEVGGSRAPPIGKDRDTGGLQPLPNRALWPWLDPKRAAKNTS